MGFVTEHTINTPNRINEKRLRFIRTNNFALNVQPNRKKMELSNVKMSQQRNKIYCSQYCVLLVSNTAFRQVILFRNTCTYLASILLYHLGLNVTNTKVYTQIYKQETGIWGKCPKS